MLARCLLWCLLQVPSSFLSIPVLYSLIVTGLQNGLCEVIFYLSLEQLFFPSFPTFPVPLPWSRCSFSAWKSNITSNTFASRLSSPVLRSAVTVGIDYTALLVHDLKMCFYIKTWVTSSGVFADFFRLPIVHFRIHRNWALHWTRFSSELFTKIG